MKAGASPMSSGCQSVSKGVATGIPATPDSRPSHGAERIRSSASPQASGPFEGPNPHTTRHHSHQLRPLKEALPAPRRTPIHE
jgi:hypothetical protein